ncbi:MAG: polyisoprenoid-binding protein, partial [Planctomycetia bacterium]|nr:polyisoprenoid-binding protein [Planctomycetia bacterium]
MRPFVRTAAVAALVTLASAVRGAHAADAPAPAPVPAPAPATPPPTIAVPRVDGLVLDGTLTDA